METRRIVSAAAILLILIAAAAGIGGYMGYHAAARETPHTATAVSTDSGFNDTVYRDMYRSAMNAVVAIKVIYRDGSTSQGTGFLYNQYGDIVTNHHVIAGAHIVEVQFRGGGWRRADVVGTDMYSDLAVLTVDNPPENAAPLPIAAETPPPGTRVMALGNPFGLQETITHGIISGVNRQMQTVGGFTIPDTIQTDAPINPGNSGGPLLNEDGVVVGVNRAKQGDNIGFAISPEIVRRVVPALIRDGNYQHPYLGVNTVDVSPLVAEANDLPRAAGVIVTHTPPHSPNTNRLHSSNAVAFTEQGTVPVGGDVLLAVNETTITSSQMLSAFIATETRPGDTLPVTLLRNGERQQETLRVGARPEIQNPYS